MTMSETPGMFELIRHEDDERELIATGTAAQLAAQRLDIMEDDQEANPGWSGHYAVVPADLTGCVIGQRGGICPASEHAMH